MLTDSARAEIAALELRHRRRARVEDAIRCGKECWTRNLPFHDFAANEAWLEPSLIAQELLCWPQALLLSGALAVAEPKRLARGVAKSPAPGCKLLPCFDPSGATETWRMREHGCASRCLRIGTCTTGAHTGAHFTAYP